MCPDPSLSCILRRFQASLATAPIPPLIGPITGFACDNHTKNEFIRPRHCDTVLNHAMPGALSVKAHCLPFSQIPHTTRLFTDFLAYSQSVQPFYPRPPHFAEWLKEKTGKISYDASRRERVTSILERQNRSWDASSKTLANLDRLRKGAVAVVTGQQVGLFGGPMFAIYKALTAVKLGRKQPPRESMLSLFSGWRLTTTIWLR